MNVSVADADPYSDRPTWSPNEGNKKEILNNRVAVLDPH